MPDFTNSANQVRFRINDRLRFEQETLIGDGLLASFKLKQGAPFSTLTAATAYLLPSQASTGCTFDNDLGRVSFSGAISANSAIQAQYQWSVFSDDEINYMLYTAQGGGSIVGVAILCVEVLMFDSLRRAKWAAPDGTQYDDTAAMKQLNDLYKQLHEELREAPEGGIESWSDNQAVW